MNTEELMIGDWVMIDDIDYPNPEQIGGIKKKHGGFYAYFPRWDLLVDIEKLNPIPLTAEILEKNGFIYYNYGHNNYGWKVDDYERFVIEKSYKNLYQIDGDNSFYIGIVEDDGESYFLQTFCTISCVHELQHAMRLCGIDKAIEL